MRAALAWAGQGWQVFPCAPGGKPPALRDTDWRDIATTDPGQIERWWTARPYNIGIDCGKSGLAVIDLDTLGHGSQPPGHTPHQATGLDALYRISTPSGGYHLYYTAPHTGMGSSTARLAPLIDIRAADGYIIAPGSRIGGRAYAVLNLASTIPLAPMPQWLADLHEQPAPAPGPHPGNLIPVQHGNAYARAALRNEAAAVTAAPRYHDTALNRASFKLGQLAAAGLLTETEIRHELTAAAARTGLSERQVTRTIDRGLAADLRTPRHLSPRLHPPELQIPRPSGSSRTVPRPLHGQ
jgi:hypothetical protein